MRGFPRYFRVTLALALCLCGAGHVHADAPDQARAVFADLRASLMRIESQLPAIAAAADAAAALIVDGAGLLVHDEPLSYELTQSPGAMFVSRQARNVRLSLADDRWVIEAGDRRFAVDTAGVPVASAWVFQCELFSACVRRGEVPVVRQSFEIDTRRSRYWRYEGQRFHHDRWLSHTTRTPVPESAKGGITANPFAPGMLGRRYLAGLRGILLDLETAGWDAIAEAIHRANDARAAGGTVYVVAGGPYLPYQLAEGAPHLHAGLQGVNEASHLHAGLRLLRDETPGVNDFVIAVGVDAPVGGQWWGDVDRLRAAGLGVAWIVNACNTGRGDLVSGDLVIDLWTPVGDGLVKVDHYDARLGPANTFAADAVMRAIVAGLKH